MSDFTSRVYRPDPEQCCEACVFGRGVHAEWCPGWVVQRPSPCEICGHVCVHADWCLRYGECVFGGRS